MQTQKQKRVIFNVNFHADTYTCPVASLVKFTSSGTFRYSKEFWNFQMTIIYPDGITYHFWSQTDVHLIMKVYIFNITNKDAFLAGKEKLRLQEIGPYIYR